jgi:hypothetical protein
MSVMLMPRCKPNSANFRPVVQAKMRVSQPNDRAEREADQSADHVVRTMGTGDRDGRPQLSPLPGSVISRSESRGSGHAAGNSGTGGSQMPASVRSQFEGSFGFDFNNVRIHPNSSHTEAIRARAFTVGNDITFGPGEYSPQTHRGRWLLAHELSHVVQQSQGGAAASTVYRKADPVEYEGCNSSTTTEEKWNEQLDNALIRARCYADVAIAALNRDPADELPNSPYLTALERHFLNPSKGQRMAIRFNFIRLRDELKASKIRCAATDADKDFCLSAEEGLISAFAREGQDWLCFGFWMEDRNCKAMTLIHEAAHIIGLGDAAHPPYRGSDEYPFGGGKPKTGQTTTLRMDNPDAYGYFGSHIWREIDSSCHVFAQTINVVGTAPPVSSKPKGEEQ